jgi:hypothetical protein
LLLIGALVVAIALVLDRRDDLTAGPVVGEANALSFPAVVGEKFAFGVPLAFNDGDQTAVLRSISLANASTGLKLVETRVAGDARKNLYNAFDYRWPSKLWQDLRPVAGYELEPRTAPGGKRGVELVFVMRAEKAGRYSTTGAVVDYRVGDREHRVTLRNAMRACVQPRNKQENDCPTPEVPPKT